jgi:hypothetical protein
MALLKRLECPMYPWTIIDYLRRLGAWDDLNNPYRMSAVNSRLAVAHHSSSSSSSPRAFRPVPGVVSLDDLDSSRVRYGFHSSYLDRPTVVYASLVASTCKEVGLVEFASVCNRRTDNCRRR